MIGILLDDNAFEQDIRELMMAFYPGETFAHEENPEVSFYIECRKNKEQNGYEIRTISCGTATFHTGRADEQGMSDEVRREWEDYLEGRPVAIAENNRLETKNRVKRRLYFILQGRTGKQLPWGTLTGIRPSKIAITLLEEGRTREGITRYMRDTYLASDEKIDLTITTAEHERSLLADFDYRHGYSLYVGIPFCPTTCLYCSFTSYPIGRWKGRTQEYLDALYREMDYVAETMGKPVKAVAAGTAESGELETAGSGVPGTAENRVPGTAGKMAAGSRQIGRPLHLDTVYFGGGTPTSLSAEDLDQLLTRLEDTFPLAGIRELTVEAGRPDSITREKLEVLKKHHITRISINPQTMKQETLDIIGRHHTVDMVRECFYMARELGFDNINMDLIVGLPEEDIEDVRNTMEEIQALNPDSITVHSLAIKRASRLNTDKEHYGNLSIQNTQEMIDLTAEYARKMGMEPYYLYRQKNMAGNFENVGYAKPGKACLYNILIMEEKQTIAACGAGTTTKVVFPAENRKERAENVKDVEQYIARVDEMIDRKRTLL